MLLGDEVGICLGFRIVATWLAIISGPFKRLDLILYMCTSGTLNVITLYGCGSGGMTSVSSGMMLGSVCGGLLFLCPGAIVIFAFMFTL